MTNDDNRANQLNPNNDAFWQSRGFEDREDAEWWGCSCGCNSCGDCMENGQNRINGGDLDE